MKLQTYLYLTKLENIKKNTRNLGDIGTLLNPEVIDNINRNQVSITIHYLLQQSSSVTVKK